MARRRSVRIFYLPVNWKLKTLCYIIILVRFNSTDNRRGSFAPSRSLPTITTTTTERLAGVSRTSDRQVDSRRRRRFGWISVLVAVDGMRVELRNRNSIVVLAEE